MTKSRKPKERAAPAPGPGAARALYETDLTFRLLIDEWVRERRCPLVLVDRCLELNLPNQAECARWAAAQAERWCGRGANRKEILCGTYPCKHKKDFYFVTDDINKTSAYALPLARTGRRVSYVTNKFPTALDAILWLLDTWTA
jgi:hypothetical protein